MTFGYDTDCNRSIKRFLLLEHSADRNCLLDDFLEKSHHRVTLVLGLEALLVLVGEISFILALYFHAEDINWNDTFGLALSLTLC